MPRVDPAPDRRDGRHTSSFLSQLVFRRTANLHEWSVLASECYRFWASEQEKRSDPATDEDMPGVPVPRRDEKRTRRGNQRLEDSEPGDAAAIVARPTSFHWSRGLPNRASCQGRSPLRVLAVLHRQRESETTSVGAHERAHGEIGTQVVSPAFSRPAGRTTVLATRHVPFRHSARSSAAPTPRPCSSRARGLAGGLDRREIARSRAPGASSRLVRGYRPPAATRSAAPARRGLRRAGCRPRGSSRRRRGR